MVGFKLNKGVHAVHVQLKLWNVNSELTVGSNMYRNMKHKQCFIRVDLAEICTVALRLRVVSPLILDLVLLEDFSLLQYLCTAWFVIAQSEGV